MAKRIKRDMRVHNMEIRKAVKIGVDPDSPLIKRHIKPEVIKELEIERQNFIEGKSPTALQKSLLDRYNSDPNNTPANTIDEIIDNNIFKIRRAVQNMIDYGDARVFKLIPSEVIKEIELYGMVAQEGYKNMLSRMGENRVFVIPEHYKQCSKCGKYKRKRKFYASNSDINNGYCHICADCANELFKSYMKKYKDVREVLILMSHKLDLYVYEPILQKYVKYYNEPDGKKEFLEGKFFSKYVYDLAVQKHLNPDLKDYMFENTKLEGVPFKCVVSHALVPQIYNDKFVVEVVNDVEEKKDEYDVDVEDAQLSQTAIKRLEYKFGKYPPQDLKWLELRYREWEDAYDITELNKKKLVTQMCCDELTIVRGRERGEDVSKLWKAYMETMKTSGLTPKQQAKTATSNGFNSLSEFIKEAEKHGPIIERQKEFNDVDGIRRFMIAIAGAIARTLGKKNEYTDAFENIYQEYTSSLLDLDSGDEYDEE